MKNRRVAGLVVLAATVVFALAPLYRSGDVTVPVHHLLHAIMLFGAALAALLLTASPKPPLHGSTWWLVLAVIAPLLAMLLMWPSEYSVFDRSPLLHTSEHMGLVVLGFVTAFAGCRYAPGIGAVASASLVLMALLAIGGYGISPPPTVR